MKKNVLVLITILFFILSGCSQETMEQYSTQELGGFSFGTLGADVDEKTGRFYYYGEEIRIHYHIEGRGHGVLSEMAWFAFVDGIPQPTRLEKETGEIFRETSYMHNFSLNFGERFEFYVVFIPVSGVQGEQTSFIAGGLLQPNFLPTSVEQPFFGFYHHLFAPLPNEIQINSEIYNTHAIYIHTNFFEIPQSLIDAEQLFLSSDEDVISLREFIPRIDFIPYGENLQINYEDVIIARNGNARFQLLVYGGQEVRNRITFFVNHQPVQVNNADFIEIQMINGQVALINVELELDNLADDLNALYAIMMAAGTDYLIQDNMFKTPTILLVNE